MCERLATHTHTHTHTAIALSWSSSHYSASLDTSAGSHTETISSAHALSFLSFFLPLYRFLSHIIKFSLYSQYFCQSIRIQRYIITSPKTICWNLQLLLQTLALRLSSAHAQSVVRTRTHTHTHTHTLRNTIQTREATATQWCCVPYKLYDYPSFTYTHLHTHTHTYTHTECFLIFCHRIFKVRTAATATVESAQCNQFKMSI